MLSTDDGSRNGQHFCFLQQICFPTPCMFSRLPRRQDESLRIWKALKQGTAGVTFSFQTLFLSENTCTSAVRGEGGFAVHRTRMQTASLSLTGMGHLGPGTCGRPLFGTCTLAWRPQETTDQTTVQSLMLKKQVNPQTDQFSQKMGNSTVLIY